MIDHTARAAFLAPTLPMGGDTRCRDVFSEMPSRWADALREPVSR